MTPVSMEMFGLLDRQGVELVPVRVPDAVDIGHQDQLPRPESRGNARSGVIRVHVADDAFFVARERGNDRHLPADEDRVEEVAPDAHDVERRGRGGGCAGR